MAQVTNSDLTQSLEDLTYNNTTTNQVKTRGSSELGKEEFLKLLVCQMQNQDPLNPQSDQEFIAQLAQFSSLEQMTNLNSTMSNTSAYGLVGKEVIVQKKDSDGTTTEVRGTVDSVIMKNGHAQLTINGVNYDLDDLVEVMDDVYASQKYRPSVKAQTIKYDKNSPTMSTIEINLGSNGYQASSVAVAVNGEYINKDYLSYNDGKLTISPDAFKELSPGTYNLTFTFDDVYSTSVNDKVSVVVTDGTSGDNKTE
ncbi:flagellar hook capping protein [Clostridium sp. CAG:167]|jgi:flagellar basal-body rod modification protein FlgD|nr:flagellar hook capping protein [Clostridium sp. CAG:167]